MGQSMGREITQTFGTVESIVETFRAPPSLLYCNGRSIKLKLDWMQIVNVGVNVLDEWMVMAKVMHDMR